MPPEGGVENILPNLPAMKVEAPGRRGPLVGTVTRCAGSVKRTMADLVWMSDFQWFGKGTGFSLDASRPPKKKTPLDWGILIQTLAVAMTSRCTRGEFHGSSIDSWCFLLLQLPDLGRSDSDKHTTVLLRVCWCCLCTQFAYYSVWEIIVDVDVHTQSYIYYRNMT